MKKIIFILCFFLHFTPTNTKAEIYHGIDIDEVYQHSDWNNKDDIKQLIDDYTRLLEYQRKFTACPNTLPEVLTCYDSIAKEIITTLFISPDINIDEYMQLKQSLINAYSLKNCRNKYAYPSGHMCNIDTSAETSIILKQYIQGLLDFSKEKMFTYSDILKNYQ